MSDLRQTILRAVKRLQPYEVDRLVRKLEAVMPRWIAVTEGLPGERAVNPHGVHSFKEPTVLVTDGRHVDTGRYNILGELWHRDESDGLYGFKRHYLTVTHWQPLPQPPEVPHD